MIQKEERKADNLCEFIEIVDMGNKLKKVSKKIQSKIPLTI